MLIICSISHFLNDMIQSIIPSIYPIVKDKFDFVCTDRYHHAGLPDDVFHPATFTGLYADKHPRPYALSLGMCFTLVGLLLLAFAENYFLILLAVSVVGLGSSVFHPTASKSGTDGIGRQEESGLIYLSGGRQWRIGSRSAAGCHHHPAFRTACHLLVCPCSPPRCHHHGKIGSLVQGTTGLRGEPSAETTASQYPYFQRVKYWAFVHPHHARVLQVFLYGVHHELLHLLPDG